MSQHLKEFARHLVDERGGHPIPIATLVAVFTNLGNPIDGATPEEQRATARKLIGEDEGLALDAETDVIDTPNDGESAEDFAARRARGLKNSNA